MNIRNNIFRSASTSLFVGMSLCVTGCMAEAEDMDADVDAIDGPDMKALGPGGDDDPSTYNHLRKICFWDYRFHRTARALANAAIANASGSMPSMPNMTSPSETGDYAGCRRDVLQVMVECALSSGTTIKDWSDVTQTLLGPFPKQYSGELGIAPGWRNGPLSTSEKAYVTACMMQKMNVYGATINILLSGATPALTHDVATYLTWSYGDNSVWGNLFDSTNSLPSGSGNGAMNAFTPSSCTYNAGVCPNANAMLRVCDTVDCGLNSMGDCDNAANYCAAYPYMPQCAGRAYRVSSFLDVDGACY